MREKEGRWAREWAEEAEHGGLKMEERERDNKCETYI